jgi:hypothetical protein
MPAIMSHSKRRAYRDALELKLRRCRGDMLQHFLAAVAAKVWGDNFIPATAHYTQGDLKCDGLLKDPLTVFACYGPTNGGSGQTEGATAQAVAKISSDFYGALKEWPEMEAWVFVTNYVDGIPPQITKKVLQVEQENPGLTMEQMALTKFASLIFDLEINDIVELLGEAASEEDFRALQLPEIRIVVDGVMAKMVASGPGDDEPVVVPADKLDFNRLAAPYRGFIKLGFQNAAKVENYLLNNYQPTMGEEVARTFRQKYLEFKSQHLSPDDIMEQLFDFALSVDRASTPRAAAIWSLLAYLFERCTIFEDKPVDAVNAQ